VKWRGPVQVCRALIRNRPCPGCGKDRKGKEDAIEKERKALDDRASKQYKRDLSHGFTHSVARLRYPSYTNIRLLTLPYFLILHIR
jgi:hypothetical protein